MSDPISLTIQGSCQITVSEEDGKGVLTVRFNTGADQLRELLCGKQPGAESPYVGEYVTSASLKRYFSEDPERCGGTAPNSVVWTLLEAWVKVLCKGDSPKIRASCRKCAGVIGECGHTPSFSSIPLGELIACRGEIEAKGLFSKLIHRRTLAYIDWCLERGAT